MPTAREASIHVHISPWLDLHVRLGCLHLRVPQPLSFRHNGPGRSCLATVNGEFVKHRLPPR